jgi:hypothetical protein
MKDINPLEWIRSRQKFLSINKIEIELGMSQGTLKKPLNEARGLAPKWENPLKSWIISRFYS